MVKLKGRTLKELYTGTDSISEQEVTPLLRGSCHVLGYVGETHNDTSTNTVLSQSGSDSGCYSISSKVHMRAESGTCNVCSAPCSSCVHVNRNLMESQVDEISDENCQGETDSQYSINEGDCCPPIKSRASDILLYTASETSNILSVTSSHNPSSENVESKANLKSPYISSCVSEGVEMCPNSKTQAAIDLVTLSNKFKDTVPKDEHNKHDSIIEDEDENELRDMSEDENDDSDLVEHDVKVCDICGDAGREDLLAVCSRCSDGAEHTYCMREKLDKLPGDDWVCDECYLDEESEKQKHNKDETLNQNYPNVKLDLEDSDVETNKTKKITQRTHVSYKRPSDKIDVDSAAKRRDSEPSASSPKVSNPNRTTSLSRDSSFKNIEKGKVKLSHQMSFGTSTATTSPRFQSAKGSLFKSSSFNSVNNKPRVNPADDLISHKQKGVRELGSFEPKEGSIKGMTKSMSFKSSNSARSSAPESKVKMISPRFPQFQDVREHRKAKDRNTPENKSNSDAPVINSAFRDSNPMQTEGKFTSSKPIGKDKRQSLLPTNGMCISEEPLESAQITASALDVDARDSTNQTERTADNLVPHSRHGVTCPRPSSVDTSASRGSVDVINEDNKLKAAIHAAMLKKPGIYKKKIIPDHTDELSSTNLNYEAASQKQHPFRTCDLDVVTPSDGKHSMREFPTHSSAMLSAYLQTSVIPEHDYIWQGGFEVHRSGKFPELCPGIQAHLSTCVSPKVIDVVNKFSFRVPLTEVPRLSTWPMHFQESGPTEDHIALYFFAQDVESYDRNYRSLLESMIKNDIALKGSIDGFELLVFSSNQLPKKSQRWNMMFYLWGVFRAQRVNCSDHMSFSENLDVAGPIDEKSSGIEKNYSSVLDSKTSTSLKVPILPSPELIDGSRDFKLSLLKIPISSTQLCTKSGNTHISQEVKGGEDRNLDVELPIRRSSFYRSVEKSRSHDILNDQVKINSVSYQDAESSVRVGTENILGISNENVKDENGSDMEISSNRKRPHIDLMETASQSSSCTNEKATHNGLNKLLAGEETFTKKFKTESNGVYVRESGIIDKCAITQDLGYPERHFFPVVSNQVSEYQVGDISLNSGILKRHHDDDVPNLNLALGAETKPQGMLPFFTGIVENTKNDKKKAHEQEEDVTASLCLSLSFPLGEKERPNDAASKLEPVLSEKRRVKSPFHLFKGFPDE